MTSIRSKPSFMNGIHYLDRQQYHAKSHGDKQMLNRRFEFSKHLYSKDLFAHYGCVNALEFSKNGEWLVSGGDDKRVLLWNIDKTLSGSYHPKPMTGEHNSNIFCLGFSNSNSKIFSGGNDEQVILHDTATGAVLDVFFHDDAVYGLSVDPLNDNVFASACDDGHILIWDIRLGSRTFNDPFTLAKCTSAYHAVMYNPVEPRFLTTANAKDGVCLWDVRKPKVHFMKYGPTLLSQSAMSVCFNSMGTHLLALRRRFPPVLYDITSTHPVAEFDHQEYYNSCTMKTCCFAGDQDQYILSGSDDFKLYAWKIPKSVSAKKGVWVSKAHMVLRGHRSIVNQVRYNNTFGLLASSGVEKVVKLWSSFPLSYREDWSSYVTSKDQLRKVYSHEEYINLVLESGQVMTHDYSNHSVQEDQRMMAFFDSLVQRDIEGWTSDSNDASESMNTCYVVQSSDSMSSSGSSSSSEDEIPKVDAPNGICAITRDGPPATVHSPPALSVSLPYITQRALESSENGEEPPDPSLDMISMLIAQKRREQMAKTTRMSLKVCKKTGKVIRKGCRKSSRNDQAPAKTKTPATINIPENDTEDKEHSHRLSQQYFLKTVRKVIMGKRRSRLSKIAGQNEQSSDSDDSEPEHPTNTMVGNHSNCDDNADDSDDSVVVISSTFDEKKNVTANVGLVSENNLPNSNESNGVGSNSLNDEVNGTEPRASSSNNLATFSAKSGKRKGRNYRKRSADDVDDK